MHDIFNRCSSQVIEEFKPADVYVDDPLNESLPDSIPFLRQIQPLTSHQKSHIERKLYEGQEYPCAQSTRTECGHQCITYQTRVGH